MTKIKKLKGRAWIFGDVLNVDWEIYPYHSPAVLSSRPRTLEEFGKHCMTMVDPDFPEKVKKGDFIVAGENMGYGHDHDGAPKSIIGCGVAAVICDSTNRNFFRNSVHLGLPVIEYKGIRDKVKEGDELEVDLRAGVIKNLSTGEDIRFPPFPEFMLEILEAGGLYPLLKKKLAEGEMPLYARV